MGVLGFGRTNPFPFTLGGGESTIDTIHEALLDAYAPGWDVSDGAGLVRPSLEQIPPADPTGRVPADVASLAVHIMGNTALTGATFDIDGGQQLVS